MGFIADLAKARQTVVAEARDSAVRSWREVFTTSKEDGQPAPRVRPSDGGSYGRSIVSSDAAAQRLLQALRSMAPGGWSDNRFEQARHFVGIQYECFPAGTRIRMADGSYKSIEKVGLREKVLTAEGNVHQVGHCFVHQHEGELINLRLWGHRHLRMTSDHEVLTKRGYIPVKELTKNDWVAIPRYLPSRISVLQTAEHVAGEVCRKQARVFHATAGIVWTRCREVPDLIELSSNFGQILGLYLAEAHTTKSGEITWSFDAVKERDTLVPELVGLLEGFGFAPRVSSSKYNSSVIQVHVCGKLWVRLFHSLCGKGAGAKRLHPDLLAAPDGFLQALLSGWLAGDGCKEKGRYSVGATVSHDLALNMFDIGNALGMRPTLLRQKQSGGVFSGRELKNQLPIWKVFFRAISDNYRVQMDEKHVWRKVESLGREPFSGEVFNVEVSGDHSYVAEGIGVHNCIHRSGEQLGNAEFKLYEKDTNHPDGKRPVTPDDPPQQGRIVRPYGLIDLLEKPNPDDSFGDLMYEWNLQLDLTGMALTWMVPNSIPNGRHWPFQLFPIPTATAIPQPAVNPDFPDGYYRIQPVYPYGPFSSNPTPASAVGAPIPAQWMLRFKYKHPILRYDGYSPQTALRLHLDECEMVDRSRHYGMRRGIHPSAVLNMDGMEGAQPLPYDEILRIKAEFEESQMGPENFGNLFVAAPGSKLEEFGHRPIDMDYQAGWDQLVGFIMAGFGASKSVVGMTDNASYANVYASLKQFHLLTLLPKCNRIATKLTRHLAPFFGDNLILEIRPPRIDDHEVVRAKVETLIQARAITKNEARKELDLPITEEDWGEEMAGVDARLEKQIERDIAEERLGKEEGIDPEKATPRSIVAAALNGKGPEQQHEKERPKPGKLGEGSLGPRKFLKRFSLNGNGKH